MAVEWRRSAVDWRKCMPSAHLPRAAAAAADALADTDADTLAAVIVLSGGAHTEPHVAEGHAAVQPREKSAGVLAQSE